MKVKRENQDHWWGLLDEIDDIGLDLSEWEIDFVESLMKRRESSPGLVLTKPQQMKIENIHDRRVLNA